VVDRRFVFHASEKEAFRSILRKLERFLDVRVATYCLMGNHFHLLLEVPERETLEPLTPESLLRRLPLLYGPDKVNEVAAEFERARVSGSAAWEKEILSRYERRRADLSIFLKELKQRVSIFVNRRLERTGTLWEGRFKSVLVEGGEQALLTVAAYIDLNPVRAGLVKRPEDYRWSGYGEAVGGSKGAAKARDGLATIHREGLESDRGRTDWPRILARYRRLLYLEGVERKGDETTGAGTRRGISSQEAEQVLDGTATLSLPEVLRHRVRYFCDGAVLGSEAFVEEAFERLRERDRIGRRRRTGARLLRGAAWGDLRVLRDLRVRVIGAPPS
jgi:REP element-mobilizing transposase RayT